MLNKDSFEPVQPTDFKSLVFDKVLHIVDSELQRRFIANSGIIKGITCLNPKSKNFMDKQMLLLLTQNYSFNTESLETEIRILKNLIIRHEEQTAVKTDNLFALLKLLEQYKLALHDLYKLSQIAVTIPASSASCERTFSCLRRVKTYLRNLVSDERLSYLSTLAIERNVTKSIDLQRVVDDFAISHNNRRINLV